MEWPRELDLLHETGWLADTPEPFRAAVLSRCRIRRILRNEAIYREGDPAGGLYGLASGGFGVELVPDDREPYFAMFVQTGFWVGEGSVLTRRPRVVGVRATRDSLFAHLPLAQWDAIVRSEPEAWRWFAHLPLRNQLLAIQVADALMIRGSEARVAAVLLILAGQIRAVGRDAPLSIEICHEDLGRMANLARSSVGQILKRFEQDGLVESAYRQIRVIDLAGLHRRRAR